VADVEAQALVLGDRVRRVEDHRVELVELLPLDVLRTRETKTRDVTDESL